MSASAEDILTSPEARIFGQRLLIMPFAVALAIGFAALAGYPGRMVSGTVLAGTGFLIVALANALLLGLTVELRSAGLALLDFLPSSPAARHEKVASGRMPAVVADARCRGRHTI